MLENGRYEVANQYVRAVRREGSPAARRLIDEVFEISDRKWRGIGLIPDSGYRLRPAYSDFDAERRFAVEGIQVSESKVCISGLILQGLKKPHQCPAFGKACTPQTPLGATMVSAEGACAAYYHYGRYRDAETAGAPAVATVPQAGGGVHV
jgi:hydrogenase expression/formation protein HypD